MSRNRLMAVAVAVLGGWSVLPSAQAGELVCTIDRVRGTTLETTCDDYGKLTVQVSSSTEVTFANAGDRRNYPNPSARDLRAGMGVRFVNTRGTLDRISVHYVPAGRLPEPEEDRPTTVAPSNEKLKVRIENIDFRRREMRADVAGRSRTFRLDSSSVAADFQSGDLVVVTVSNGVVTRMDLSEVRGVVTRIDERRRTIEIEVNRRARTYGYDNSNEVRDLREGDRVRFEVEERGSREVAVSIRRDRY